MYASFDSSCVPSLLKVRDFIYSRCVSTMRCVVFYCRILCRCIRRAPACSADRLGADGNVFVPSLCSGSVLRIYIYIYIYICVCVCVCV